MNHVKGLDTLRVFAVLFVILDHWGINDSIPFLAFLKNYIVPGGQAGVDLFFVLSGFLITGILLAAKNADNPQPNLTIIKNFMIRRVLRIFPIYYLLIFLLLAINYHGIRAHAWYYLTYTTNILFFRQGAWGVMPHTWSLCVEEQFYLLWPWLILFTNKKYLSYLFVAAITTGIISSYITSDIMNRPCQPVLVFDCIGCLALGGFYAYARTETIRCQRFEKVLFPIFIVCLIINIHWIIFPGDGFWHKTTTQFRMVHGVIALQIIIAIFNNRSKRLRRYLLENSTLNFIGKISYGIYLYHYLLNPLPDLVRALLLLPICILSYKFIEQPLLNLKNKFR